MISEYPFKGSEILVFLVSQNMFYNKISPLTFASSAQFPICLALTLVTRCAWRSSGSTMRVVLATYHKLSLKPWKHHEPYYSNLYKSCRFHCDRCYCRRWAGKTSHVSSEVKCKTLYVVKKANEKTSCVKFICLQEPHRNKHLRRWVGKHSCNFRGQMQNLIM